MVRITPLLNVHRTEYELKQKSVSTTARQDDEILRKSIYYYFSFIQDELEQLRSRVDKLEQERSQLKMDNDRLEQRVSKKFFNFFDRVFFLFYSRSLICRLIIGPWPNAFDFLSRGRSIFMRPIF